MKNKIIKIFNTLATLVTVLLLSNSAGADHLYPARQTCEEISQHFDDSLALPPIGAVFNTIQQNCENLGHHETFPGAHEQPIDLSQHKPSVKTSHQPWSEHTHKYFNDSKEKLNQKITVNGQTQTVNFYYLSAVDTFEMHLESDFMKNVDLSTIQCAGLPNGNNCTGTGTLGNDNDGKNIGFNVSFNKSNGIIKWHFPGSSQGWAKPNFRGENPTLDDIMNSPEDTTDDKNRMLSLAVNFKSKDIDEESWSATVTSRVLIKDFVAQLPPNTEVKTSDWKAITHTANQTGEFGDYYWFPIGTTTTIWDSPAPSICTDLKATLGKSTTVNGKKAYPITLNNVTFAPENKIPEGAQVKWTAINDPTAEFWKETFLYGEGPDESQDIATFIKIGTGSVTTTTTPNTKVYFIGKATSIKVELVGVPEDQIGKGCIYQVQIPPEELECKEIIVEDPGVIYEGDTVTFKAKAVATNGQDWPGNIRYSVDTGHGAFYLVSPFSQKKSSQASNIDPILLIIGNEKSQISQTAVDLIGDILTGDFTGDIFNHIDAETANKNIDKLGLPFSPAFKKEVENRAKDLKSKPSRSSKNESLDLNKSLQANSLLAFDFNSSLNPAGSMTIDGTNLPDVTVKKPIKFIDTDLSPKFNPEKDSLLNGVQFKEEFVLGGSPSPHLVVKPNTSVYFTAEKEGNDVIHVAAEGTDNPACKADFDILKKPVDDCINLTTDLRLYGGSSVSQLEANKIYSVDANSTYKLPDERQVIYSIEEAYGTFVTIDNASQLLTAVTEIKKLQASNSITKANLVTAVGAANLSQSIIVTDYYSVVFVTYSNIPGAKEDVLTVTSAGSSNDACTDTFDIIAPPPQQLVCEDLTFKLFKVQGATVTEVTPAKLEPLTLNGYYIIDPNVVPANDYNITYTVVAGYGQFLNGSTTITTTDEANIFFFPNPNATTDNAAALTMQVVGAADLDCQKVIPFDTEDVPPPPPGDKKCISLDLELEDGDEEWIVDEDEDDNDEQEFQISVITENLDKETLKYRWEVDGPGEWEGEDGDDTITITGTNEPTLENFGDGTEVSVEVDDYESACHDSIEAEVKKEDEEKPELNKYVYSTNKVNAYDDVVNISKNTDYITYMLEIKTGENIETIEVQDPKLKGGKIKGDKGGTLDFIAMKIDIIDEKENEEYTIFKSEGYRNAVDGSTKFSDSKFEDRNDDLDEYEDEFSCKDRENEFCLSDDDDYDDADDFGDVKDQFKNGRKIYFNNVDKLGDNATIVIKYQMKNNSVIKQEGFCEKLSAEGGCGEEFENNATIDAESRRGKKYNCDDSKDFECEDSAKVIVICPYILTRSGGDAFFHDLIEYSVDVGQCADVKPCVGICEQPKPPGKKPITKTGPDGKPEALPILDLPSHDVCRLSNSNTNIEGYNNVLKNFSSTICELQADVAEVWTKKYINDSISANVTRVSRWGQNLNGDVTNMSSLMVPNKESGIFVKVKGNLHIGVEGGTYYIQGDSTNKIPAAQTYIVKDGNLYIDSDIKYPVITDYTDTRNISSAAFIVIDGNIIIGPNVKQIDGILMAVDATKPGTGKVIQEQETETLLTINGNLIGDVYELFKNRTGVGDPRKDQGSVTIRYDQRILLNTPPGISDLLDLEQAIVPN